MFFVKFTGYVVRDAVKHSLEQTSRTIVGTSIFWGGYSLYKNGVELLQNHGFWEYKTNNQQPLENENKQAQEKNIHSRK